MDYYYSKERSTFLIIQYFTDVLSKCIMTQSLLDIWEDGRPMNWCSKTIGGLECPYSSRIMWMAVLLAKPQKTTCI